MKQSLATIMTLALAAVAAGEESDTLTLLDKALEAAKTFEIGQKDDAVLRVEEIVFHLAPDSRLRGPVEDRLLRSLASASTVDAKGVLCRQLRVIGTPRSVPQLEAMLTDPKLSHLARYALGSIQGPQATEALYRALGKTSGSLQAGIINTLADRGCEQALGDCITLLGTSDVQVAQASARAMGRLGGNKAIKALLVALAHENHTVGKAAEIALDNSVLSTLRPGGEYGRLEACEVLAATVGDATLPQKTRACICRLLGRVGQEESVPALAAALSLQDIRNLAVDALSRNPSGAALDALHTALPNADPQFRVGVINAIGRHKNRRSVKLLAGQLQHHDMSVRIAAMEAIAGIADPLAMDLLAPMLRADSPKEQQSARAAWLTLARTLLDSKRPYAASTMFQQALVWKNLTRDDRCAALWGVGKAAQPGAIDLLLNEIKAIDDDQVCRTIAEALTDLSSSEVTKAIVAVVTTKGGSSPKNLSDLAKVSLLDVLAARKDKTGERAAVASLKSGSESVRIAALKCLAVVGSEEAAPLIAPSLKASSPREREAAALVLGTLPAPHGLTWLHDEVNKTGAGEDYRVLLIRVIGARRDPGGEEALARLLDTKQSEVIRVEALKAVGELGRAGALPALLKAVDKQTGKDRDTAQASMLKLEAGGTGAMIAAVANATPFQKVALLEVLGFRDDPRIKPLLLDGYKSTNLDVKAAAIEGLRRMADPSTLSVLEEAGRNGPASGPAVAGMIRIALKLEKDRRAEALRIYHTALTLATRDKEIKPVLDRLADLEDVSSFDVVRPFLDKGDAKNQAAEAVMATAVKLPDARKADGIGALRAAIGIRPTSDRANAARERLRKWGVEIDLAGEGGFVTHWWLAGPFKSPEKKLFDVTLPPEKNVDLSAKVRVDQEERGWKKVHVDRADGVMDFHNLIGGADHVAVCCYAEVTSDEAQDVLFKIGSDDDVVCSLNGKRIHANKVDRGRTVDADVVETRLEKGVNRIVLKVLNTSGGWEGCLRITDRQNKPLKLKQRKE
jgi:HEAT repeat protein